MQVLVYILAYSYGSRYNLKAAFISPINWRGFPPYILRALSNKLGAIFFEVMYMHWIIVGIVCVLITFVDWACCAVGAATDRQLLERRQ
jgi:hypothetical protein